ncbi:uncharacterized protein LOC110695025 [Chenopodium quinoa]|uniref:uncharacterized protein LOC110695025 n=1 Tax=Chenopodium quinoa TaxID=63459 RepID=UPI000B773463|nr:uncharacterized protein LOC110695025 [Chenopodium quinoa]
MKVNNVVYYLKEETDLWWTQKKEELMADPNFGWEDFKVALRKKFYPDHLRKQKCLEFTNLRMGTMTVSEYYSKFIELMRFAPEVVPTEAIKAQRFEQGLTWNLQGKLGGATFESLDEVYGRAAHFYGIKGRELGSMLGEKRKSNDQPQGSDKRPKNHASFGNGNHGDKRDFKGNFRRISNHGGENRENKERNKRSYFCKRCEKDHPGKDCASNKVTCRYCQKLGHREYECFKKEADLKNGKVQDGQNSPKPPQTSGPAQNTGISNGGNTSKGRIFVMNSREAETSSNVVIDTFLICSLSVKVLFDSGASHSFISKTVIESLQLESPESVSLDIPIPTGEVRECSRLFRNNYFRSRVSIGPN